MATGYYEQMGKWWIDKDPDDQLYYAIDLAEDLALSATTIASVAALVEGVEVLEAPVVLGTRAVIKLGGLDVSASPRNSCTLRFTLANGERMNKTIHFKRREK